MSDAVLMITATGSREEAERIAGVLVGERLAACVQILPATSIYRWQGAVEREEEWVLHVKTIATRVAEVERRIAELHSYDLPEVIVLPIAGGSEAYLDWIRKDVG